MNRKIPFTPIASPAAIGIVKIQAAAIVRKIGNCKAAPKPWRTMLISTTPPTKAWDVETGK
jgi:hypothetical protein